MDNLYRLFIKTETQYTRYKLGHIIDVEDYNFEDVATGFEKKITVFTRNGDAKLHRCRCNNA